MKLNIKDTYFSLLGLFLAITLQAQQDPQYTQYMYNTMAVNSGYAGSTGALEAIVLHRSQWTGISGSPQTQSLTIHTPLRNEKVGIGFSAINDKLGPSNELYLEGNFSYTIPVSYGHNLAFGLKAGARMLNVDWTKGRYYDDVDALLNNNIDNKIKPSLGAGVYYYTDKWYVGASVPSFIRGDFYDDIQESVVSERLHYYFMGGYVFDVSEGLKFKPAFLVKAVNGAPLTADVSANFLLQEKVTLGASYRWGDSVSALAGFQISNEFYIGYAFDYTVSRLNKYADGTHEFVLRFQLQKKTRQIKSPRFF